MQKWSQKSEIFRRNTQEQKQKIEQAVQSKSIREHRNYQTEQLNLFEEKFLKRGIEAEYKLIGQVFDTYWLVQFQDNLYIIDQHAAHERVYLNRTLKEMKNREFTFPISQSAFDLDLIDAGGGTAQNSYGQIYENRI